MPSSMHPVLAEKLKTLTNQVKELDLWKCLLKIAETFGNAKVLNNKYTYNFIMLFDDQARPVALEIDKSFQHNGATRIRVYCEGELVFDAEGLIFLEQRDEDYVYRHFSIDTLTIGINSYKMGEWTNLLDLERIRNLVEIKEKAREALEAAKAGQEHLRPLDEEEQSIADAFGIEM